MIQYQYYGVIVPQDRVMRVWKEMEGYMTTKEATEKMKSACHTNSELLQGINYSMSNKG